MTTENTDTPLKADCNPRLVLPSLGDLLEDYYNGSAYGDHIPKELPDLIIGFVEEHGMTVFDEGSAWDLIMESTPDDSWIKLFECIFAEGAKQAMHTLENRDLLRENAGGMARELAAMETESTTDLNG